MRERIGLPAHPEIDAFALEDFPRLVRLREELIGAQPAICVERARLLTEFHRREGFDERRPVLRQAGALAHVLDHLPTPVFGDELIVGSTTSKRLGVPIFPEFTGLTIWPELTSISGRNDYPVLVSDAEIDVLSEEVFPFWKDLTVHEYVRRTGDNPLCLGVFERFKFFLAPKSNGISHLIPDFASVVDRGLDDIADEVRAGTERACDESAEEFLSAVLVALEAVVRFAGRYADECARLAGSTTGGRAEELAQTASILRKVPAKPAKGFREALQAIWITQVALHQENTNAALSFGRLDGILDRPYGDDLESGRLDRKRAAELLGCFFIKMQDHDVLTPTASRIVLGGGSANQAVTVGGLRPDGTDGTCETSLLIIKMAELLALREPNLCARLHRGSPGEYRNAIVNSIFSTGASPAVYNDAAIIDALTAHGVGTGDARDYGLIGCVETASAGRTMSMTGAILFNLASVMELAVNGGVDPPSGRRMGPETARLDLCGSYEEFLAAFRTQLESLVDLAVECNRRFAHAHAVLHPTPLLSSLIEGTIDAGADVTRGGARYNSSGVAVVALADVADSLSALKHAIFTKDGCVSPAELMDALADDFASHERTRALLTRKVPRYGADDPAADAVAVSLVEMIEAAFSRHSNFRGGRYHVGYWSMTLHAGAFALTGSLPSGRRRGEPLASGATPVSGAARRGPTASVASTARLPAECMANCIANNHKLSRSFLCEPGRLELLKNMIDGYFDIGGMQIQFIIQDSETLLEAQAMPDRYRDLLVRVSGYNAYFCDLTREMQDEIIARTEDRLG
ncbi:MAG: hypothetical protein KJ993_02620 [Actinobacteria bacterium]|nr:hypothetical protein [Actinomycetota bacterium]